MMIVNAKKNILGGIKKNWPIFSLGMYQESIVSISPAKEIHLWKIDLSENWQFWNIIFVKYFKMNIHKTKFSIYNRKIWILFALKIIVIQFGLRILENKKCVPNFEN